jgi:hypothetical protein
VSARSGTVALGVASIVAATVLLALGFRTAERLRPVVAPAGPVASAPVLAYYYIWFDDNSWRRAKTDLPAIGTYNSDSRTVMRRQIEEAKSAGIDGFIVSWKASTKLDRRLERLIEVARSEDFKLALIYQGLDFQRHPQPIERVRADLETFAATWAADPVFDLFDKPLVIWSGTWKFSTADIASVTGRVRDRLLVLGSERDVGGIHRLAGDVDGNAYYWSSVDPERTPNYASKLQEMAEAVHAAGGLWIAPAAPGFDARLIGGTRTIERDDGQTLREQMSVAMSSGPDAIGVISWNEYSENSHIEPSQQHGTVALDALRDVNRSLGIGSPAGSDEDPDAGPGNLQRVTALALLVGVPAAGFLAVLLRDRRRGPRPPAALVRRRSS